VVGGTTGEVQMRAVYAFQCEVLPPAGQTVRQCLEALAAEAEGSLAAQLGDAGEKVPLRAERQSAGGRDLVALAWEGVDPEDPTLGWSYTCTLAEAPRWVDLSLVVSLASARFQVRPVLRQPPAPALVPEVVRRYRCQIGGQPVPAAPRLLPAGDVGRFVRNQLTNPRRALPVVMLSPDPVTGRPCLDPAPLQERLLGFGEVVTLADEVAVAELTRCLGRERACAGGLVRLYWPGFDRDADPGRHPPRSPRQLEEDGARGHPVDRQLLATFVAAAAERFCDERIADQVAEVEGEEGSTELERLRVEKRRLEEECAAARGEAEALRAELGAYRAELEAYREGGRAARGGGRKGGRGREGRGGRFASVAEALAKAGEEFGDVLAVWEDATDSARRTGSNRAGGVYRALRALAEVGRVYFAARREGRPMGPVDQAIRSRVPYKYTGTESATTRSMFGQARVFHDGDRSRQMLRHLTLARGDGKNCVQIYFDFDDESGRVDIGYCGRHLPIARQPT
jgi:hypothetical protein